MSFGDQHISMNGSCGDELSNRVVQSALLTRGSTLDMFKRRIVAFHYYRIGGGCKSLCSQLLSGVLHCGSLSSDHCATNLLALVWDGKGTRYSGDEIYASIRRSFEGDLVLNQVHDEESTV